MKNKKTTAIISLLLSISLFGINAGAQNRETSDTLTVGYTQMMRELNGSVTAPDSLNAAMCRHIQDNPKRMNTCFRIRIFFDNSRDARTVSSHMVEEFTARYPGVSVYNQYANPYFKVTVGDFRSKSDAMKFMNTVKRDYPSAFLVKESYSVL